MRTSLLLIALACAPACVRPDPAPRFTPAWEQFDPSEEDWVASSTALLMADCQLHNLYSKAVPERNLSAEAAVATAIRPPQLDLFSADVLAWILRNGAPEAEVVLHLGDALDLACEGELDVFLRVMGTSERPWFMAPGNHDFNYFGVYNPANTDLWEDACNESGAPLTKDRFVRRYLAALIAQVDPGCNELAATLGLAGRLDEPNAVLAEAIPDAFEWIAPDDVGGFLTRVCWNIDLERPWRSFLIQAVHSGGSSGRGGRSSILLLDSCQYMRRPELMPNGWQSYPVAYNCGTNGEMLPDQLRKVREWLEQDPRDSYSIACHHPFDVLAPNARSSLGWLWRERGVQMMFSAHTHSGYFAHHDLGGTQDELELNVGSTTDWPMEWRVIQGFSNEELRRSYLRADRRTMVDSIAYKDGYFNMGWEVPVDASDDYRKYKKGDSSVGMFLDYYFAFHVTPRWLPQPRLWPNAAAGRTELQVKDTLLWTYHRLVSEFPTSPGVPAEWPTGCANDVEVLQLIVTYASVERDPSDRELFERIGTFAGPQDELLRKSAFLKELELFERMRSSRDAETGESTNDERLRFKVSQAVWASRFEKTPGRRLRVEDELIRVDWRDDE